MLSTAFAEKVALLGTMVGVPLVTRASAVTMEVPWARKFVDDTQLLTLYDSIFAFFRQAIREDNIRARTINCNCIVCL